MMELTQASTTTELPELESPVQLKSQSTQTETYQYVRAFDEWTDNIRSSLLRRELRLLVNVANEFFPHLEQWKRETSHSSSMHDIVLHQSYQRIIGLGEAALPLILRELQENGGHWHWALKAITGKNPVNSANRGRASRIAQDWLTWARKEGIVF